MYNNLSSDYPEELLFILQESRGVMNTLNTYLPSPTDLETDFGHLIEMIQMKYNESIVLLNAIISPSGFCVYTFHNDFRDRIKEILNHDSMSKDEKNDALGRIDVALQNNATKNAFKTFSSSKDLEDSFLHLMGEGKVINMKCGRW
jgi:hypothetical protein